MIPASHSLVTLNPARQAALQAIADVEQRREARQRLSDDNPVTRVFMRRLTGQSRISSLVLIMCITLLMFTWLTRKSLCEIRYRDGNREVAALMAYESGK